MARTPTTIVLLALCLTCRDRAAGPGAGHALTAASDASSARGAGHGGPGGAGDGAEGSAGTGAVARARLDLGAWLGWAPSDLGCWMERSLAYRDPRWGCSAPGPPPADDPCHDGWRAGPEVPEKVARRMHPRLRRVAVAWEHGALQAATFQFDPDVPPAAMPVILGIGPGALEGAAWHGAGRCDTPCYEVVVFAPAPAACDAEDDEVDEAGADQ